MSRCSRATGTFRVKGRDRFGERTWWSGRESAVGRGRSTGTCGTSTMAGRPAAKLRVAAKVALLIAWLGINPGIVRAQSFPATIDSAGDKYVGVFELQSGEAVLIG